MPIVEGPVVRQTKINLTRGARGKPLPSDAVELISHQAQALIERAVSRYEQDVATGEVGVGGTATASADPPFTGRGPVGLLYGRVQSGKTAAMIMSAAWAIDNGFRVVLVVTANNVTLVRQTADRFKALGGPRVFSTLKDSGEYDWVGQENDLKEDIAEDGLVIVCAKDKAHLPAVMSLLEEIDAATVPALIFDDEADNATPDTTLAARSSGRDNAPPYESPTYRRVIENTAPGEQGESLREKIPHNVFLQVTATPYVLFLQREGQPIRPSFCALLEPGTGYCGGSRFFEGFDQDQSPPAPPIVLVSSAEAQSLLAARPTVPVGLANSCRFFVLAAAAHSLTQAGGHFPTGGYKHLSHTSPRIDHHNRVANLIQRVIRAMRRELRRGQNDSFQGAYDELRRTLGAAPTLDDLLSFVKTSLDDVEIVRVNSDTAEPKYGPTYNFVVGGNILGRGVTIDELLVTYYLREAITPQMDTVWQHARMYGYREPLMPYTRVYLPAHLGTLFRQIHESEEELRGLLKITNGDITDIPLLKPDRARPTRPNALETGLRVYGADVKQIVPYYVVPTPPPGPTRRILDILQQNGIDINVDKRQDRFVDVPLQVIKDIVELVPIRENDDGRWDTEAVMALLTATGDRYMNRGTIYVRSFEDVPDATMRRVRGALSGPEVDMAQATKKFTLALVYWGDASSPSGWYPHVIVPPDLPPHVFNPL